MQEHQNEIDVLEAAFLFCLFLTVINRRPTFKRVAVIGAGPSGLVTIKELLDAGHDPVCFEKAASLGGAFRFGEDDGVVWESCRLTSSGLITAFSDFPVSLERAEHMRVGEYVDYLSEYCEAFDLERHIRYGMRVDAVKRNPTGGWNVQSSNGNHIFEERFDAVAVCSGLHQHPHVPSFPGLETFPGEILHAARYRRPAQVTGKKVLIVGAGESGADVVTEVSDCAAETVLSLRRGVAVVPRRRFGKPRDYQTSRIRDSSAHWIFQTRHPDDDRKRKIYRTIFLPLVIVDKCLRILYRMGWEILPLFFSTRFSEVLTNLKTHKLTMRLLKESGGTVHEQYVTKDDCFVRTIVLGKCRRAPAIVRFEGRHVSFEDGSSFEPDLVILCTGFETKMPFLEERIVSASRYLNTFDPEIGASLGFIGFLRPGFGSIPPLSELQARWFSLLQSGNRNLPSEQEMLAFIDEWTRFRMHIFRPVRNRLEHLVDHAWFCDELAAQIGCKPSQYELRQENFSFRLRFYAAPFVAAQYRLTGPNAKPKLARNVIESLPIVRPLPDLINVYMRWMTTRILHKVLGKEYAPKLVLH